MKAVYNNKKFKKEMNNIMKYSIAFLDGVQKGLTVTVFKRVAIGA